SAEICSNVCDDLSGVYALKLTVPTTWSATQYVRSGSGTNVFWTRLVLTQSGTALAGSVSLCGRTVPDFENSLVAERYGVTFPNAIFDAALPTATVSGSLSAPTPGATISLQRTAV